MSDLPAAQRAVARFLDDPAFEAELRADPDGFGRREGLDAPLARRLAAIEPHRVAAFRASRAHKDGVRQKMARSGVSK